MKRLFVIILLSLLFGSCDILMYHKFGEVPKKPGRYPRFTEKDSLVGQLDRYRSGYDVTFYDLNLTVDPANEWLGGEVVIYFKAIQKLKNIRIDLYENLDIYGLKFKGEDIPYKRSYRAVIASLPDSLVIGRAYSLTVKYGGKPVVSKNPPWVGGLVWSRDNDGNPWIGIACETKGGSIWFPCKDHLSDEPDSARLRISVPEGLQVVSNGIMESHTSSGSREIFTWSTHYPINIYNMTFYVGKFEHFSDTLHTGKGTLNLDYYVLPKNLEKAKEHFKQVKDILSFYCSAYGPYPWIKEGFKLVEGPFAGMENQTAIAYGSGFRNLPWLGNDYIIIHEAAHEWWGNAVSVSDFSDIWLQEGFATYSEIIFVEQKMGYDRSLLYANKLAGRINNKRPLVGPTGVSYWNKNDNDVYFKGAMILNTIRNIVNDSTLFFDILQTFYREHAASSHVTTADFREVVERKTRKDWAKFFDTYLYSRKIPILHWYFSTKVTDQDRDTIARKSIPFVVAEWKNVPEGFNMPVRLDCKDCSASVTIEVTTKPTLFYIKDLSCCKQLICNKRLSYFDSKTDNTVLTEAEALKSGNK